MSPARKAAKKTTPRQGSSKEVGGADIPVSSGIRRAAARAGIKAPKGQRRAKASPESMTASEVAALHGEVRELRRRLKALDAPATQRSPETPAPITLRLPDWGDDESMEPITDRARVSAAWRGRRIKKLCDLTDDPKGPAREEELDELGVLEREAAFVMTQALHCAGYREDATPGSWLVRALTGGQDANFSDGHKAEHLARYTLEQLVEELRLIQAALLHPVTDQTRSVIRMVIGSACKRAQVAADADRDMRTANKYVNDAQIEAYLAELRGTPANEVHREPA